MTGTATDPRTGPLVRRWADAAGPAALVSDRGRRRSRNEDCAALAVRAGWVGLLVADGVGGKPEGDRASLVAAGAGREALLAAYEHGMTAEGQLLAATHAAAGAVTDLARGDAAPATTFVAAVSDGSSFAVLSVGDSRAYWVPDGGAAVALTHDDSFAGEQIALGADPAVAHAGPFAHVITRWLGSGAPAAEPAVIIREVDRPGWLLLCTDGLWHYLPAQWGLPADAEPAAVAEQLVAFANERGGADNVTVALTRVG